MDKSNIHVYEGGRQAIREGHRQLSYWDVSTAKMMVCGLVVSEFYSFKHSNVEVISRY